MAKIRRCCWLLLLSWSTAFAQQQAQDFSRLTVDDGLSHNVSRKIIQDQQGFIWVGTQSGLNRFDGYTFKKYQSNRQ